MIIECGSCKSRFRLDESKITGRGARVRCRKCGESITVMKEDVAGQGGTGAAAPGEREEGLDLRSILRETMEAPPTPAAPEPPGPESPRSDVDKMLADAAQEAEAEAAAPPAALPQDELQAGAPSVDFGPEEKLTFQQPGLNGGPAPMAEDAARTQPPASPGPDISSEFMMSTADSLDFLKADYDKGERKADLDISGSLRVAPAPGAQSTTVAPPLGTQNVTAAAPPVAPPSRSDSIRSELAGLGSAAAAGAAGAEAAAKAPAVAPPPPKAAAPPPPPLREVFAPTPSSVARTRPATKKPALKRGQGSQLVRPSVILLLVLFFALAGGGAYLGFTSDGQRVLRGLVPQIESLWLGGGKPASRYEVGNLIGYYETNAAAGKMFVIKGQLTNEGRSRKTGVRVYAALLDAQSKQVAEKTVYAGNILAGDALRKATREKIEAAMSNPIGGGLANMDIPPGKAVPFMVVFFDAPDGIDSYRLEPRDVD